MEVGERLTVKDKRGVATGTVRYIGPLEGKPGQWVGVEWDDAERGTNDGSYQGTRYFTCLRQPASASFITASKVRPGKTLTEAIHDRYTPRDDDLASMSIDTAGYRRMEVTFKGREKIADGLKALSHLTSVTVHECQISRPVRLLAQHLCRKSESVRSLRSEMCRCAHESHRLVVQGEMGMLNQLLPGLLHLRVSSNLLGSWVQVHRIVSGLQALTTLDVSSNYLQQAEDVEQLTPCTHLRTLVSSQCKVTWGDVRHVAKVFPGLRELYASENNISSMQPPLPPQHPLCQLEVLDIMDNMLQSWDDVMSLSVMTQLSVLKLSGNKVSSVTPPGSAFGSLKVLLLADNGISNWTSINALADLPSLADLRLSRNPVLSLSSLTGRNECIARLRRITQLNGAKISQHERKDCELQYLYHVQQRISDLGPEGPAEAALHPRLEELREKYGDMAIRPSRSRASETATLGEQLLDLGIVHTGGADGDEQCKQTRLPPSTSMVHLKMLCAAFFSLDVNLQRLVLHSGTRAGEEIGADNSLDLSYWNLQSGDVIGVTEAEDPDLVWREYAGVVEDHVPAHWLLPPEMRADLTEFAS